MSDELTSLIGLHLNSDRLSEYLKSLAVHVSASIPISTTPKVKSYPDAVYINHHTLGLSLLFTPLLGYKPSSSAVLEDLDPDRLILSNVDLYNIPEHVRPNSTSKVAASRTIESAFSSFPLLPFVLNIAAEIKDKTGKLLKRPSALQITQQTTGREFVECLGEPDRKGGGAGPSSGSIGIWCEWTKDGIMVEFGGDEAKGPQAWENGKDAVWKVITLFSEA